MLSSTTGAVEKLKQRGIPVFAQSVREAYIGFNNLKSGRMAVWMIARGLQGQTGEIAMFAGGRCCGHELRERGLHRYFRQNRPDMTPPETQINLDAPQLTHEATLSLLKRHKALAGIYCAGGGREGVVDAIRDEAQPRRWISW